MTLDYFYGQSGELFSYFRIPKALFQDHRFRQLSTDARTLYGILLDRMSLSVKNGWTSRGGCKGAGTVSVFRAFRAMDFISDRQMVCGSGNQIAKMRTEPKKATSRKRLVALHTYQS